MNTKTAFSIVILALAMTGNAAAETPKISGGLLVDAQGMTLYTFDQDARGKSNCSGGCAAAWPPAPIAAEDRAAGEFTIVTRDDGARQWAYRGLPLYRFAGDARTGDANGDNQGNVWHVVHAGRAPQSAPAASAAGYGSY